MMKLKKSLKLVKDLSIKNVRFLNGFQNLARLGPVGNHLQVFFKYFSGLD